MDWQQVIALLIVAATAVVFATGKFRKKRFNFSANGACGCSTQHEPASKQSIVLHARKGERPQVIVRTR